MILHVLPLLRRIPRGQLSTYGDFARFLGVPHNARQIGQILGNNEQPDIYPCYKVVASNGALTGYSMYRGLSAKQERLEEEGIRVIENRVVEVENVRWQPTFHSYFLAFPLDEPNRNTFERAYNKATRLSADAKLVNFQQRETPHVTLHYFGNLSLEKLANVVKKLREWELQSKVDSRKSIVEKGKIVSMKFQGLDYFGPSSKRETGFFKATAGTEACTKLQHELMQTLGVREDLPFVPHLTLFRVKDQAGFNKVDQNIKAALTNFQFEIPIHTVRLYGAVDQASQVPLIDFTLRS